MDERQKERLWDKLYKVFEDQQIFSIASDIQAELFHYTNVTGLKGIVESNSLYATSAYFLNDSSEINYGCQLVSRAIDQWLAANTARRISSPSLSLLEALKSAMAEPVSSLGSKYGVFVTCFCEAGNLLSQWRAYGQRGGYAIGMVASELERSMRGPAGFHSHLIKVKYDTEQQLKRIQEILRAFVELLEEQPPDFFAPNAIEGQMELSRVLLFMQEVLIDEIVAFKNPAFVEEREWRIVTRRKFFDISRVQDAEELDPDIRYRESKGLLAPYVLLTDRIGQLPIMSIRFGPTLDKFQAENGLMGFMKKHDYGHIRIYGSGMPVLL